jgi:hypothetical protein
MGRSINALCILVFHSAPGTGLVRKTETPAAAVAARNSRRFTPDMEQSFKIEANGRKSKMALLVGEIRGDSGMIASNK